MSLKDCWGTDEASDSDIFNLAFTVDNAHTDHVNVLKKCYND